MIGVGGRGTGGIHTVHSSVGTHTDGGSEKAESPSKSCCSNTDDKPFAPGSPGQDRTRPAWLHNGWSGTEENVTNIILEG